MAEPPRARRIAGGDGCRGGWLVVVAPLEGAGFGAASAGCVDGLGALAGDPGLAVLALDTPIGLDATPAAGGRAADRAARAFLAARAAGLRGTGSRVFPAPSRAQLAIWERGGDYRAVNAAHPEGPKLTLQAFHILGKIAAAERLRAVHGALVAEVHPELSFAVMAGRTLPRKAGPEGKALREAALAAEGFDLPALRAALGPPRGRWQGDDLLDACAACWSAARIARGCALRLPAEGDGGAILV